MARFIFAIFLYCIAVFIASGALAHPAGPRKSTALVSARDDVGPPPIDFYPEDRQKSWTVWGVFLTSILVGALVAAIAVIVIQLYCRRRRGRLACKVVSQP